MTNGSEAGDTTLVTCSACGGTVSSQAASCQACGHPLKAVKSYGTAILVLGIIGLIYFVTAPVAWIWGNNEIKETKAGFRTPEGERKARIGRVLGIIGTVVGGGIIVLMGIALAVQPDPEPAPEVDQEELEAAFAAAGASVLFDESWDSEFVPIARGGLGFQASPDLSSSGTRLSLDVIPHSTLDPGLSPAGWFLEAFDASLESAPDSTEVVSGPSPISAAGVDGYVTEVNSEGAKTGQPLGTRSVILFGWEYSYFYIVQWEAADEEMMRQLLEDFLEGIVLPDAAL